MRPHWRLNKLVDARMAWPNVPATLPSEHGNGFESRRPVWRFEDFRFLLHANHHAIRLREPPVLQRVSQRIPPRLSAQ